MDRSAHVAAFRRLHQDGILVLANAWDAGSARLIESLGAKAIATTSAGVAWSHGYADGDVLPVPRLLGTVSGILDAIRIPLTVDIEGGYSDDPRTVGELVAQLAGMGVAGINLEDGTAPPQRLCAKIEAIKRACSSNGTDVFVNARTDVYLRGLVSSEHRIEETLKRASLYRAAGADGLFVPGIADRTGITAVAADAQLPLNVLARASLPVANELEAWGVRRLSAGSDIAESTYRLIASLAAGFLRDGLSAPLSANAMPYAELNALFVETGKR
ncbi:MAG TPA: isocitrate lyase/phosphoenolpyruvate mutase family protein [Lysobacter sp.]|nr:isocitrate lyase/phosphoenolpyruvate mutase family protein [Lysobacter sp.]